jgi:protein-disulfide isomerase
VNPTAARPRVPAKWVALATMVAAISAGATRAISVHAADPAKKLAPAEPSVNGAATAESAGAKPKPERAFADKPLAKLGDQTITFADLDPVTALRIYRQRAETYALFVRAVNDVVERRLLAAEAKRRGVSPKELDRMLDADVEPVTPADVDAYLAANPVDAEPDARERAATYLTEQRRNKTRLDIVAALREREHFKMLLPPPVPPRVEISTANAPARGPADAPVVLVHFASFTSQRSAVSAEQIRRLVREMPERIRWVHRSLIRANDEVSLAAAELAAEAADKGKFWDVHDRLFELGGSVKAADLERVAQELGLSPMRPGVARYRASIERDAAEARRAGVDEEPVIFVNGRYFGPSSPYVELRALVTSELGEASSDQAARGTAPDELSDDEP